MARKRKRLQTHTETPDLRIALERILSVTDSVGKHRLTAGLGGHIVLIQSYAKEALKETRE